MIFYGTLCQSQDYMVKILKKLAVNQLVLAKYVLRYAHMRYAKSLFTNIQKQ